MQEKHQKQLNEILETLAAMSVACDTIAKTLVSLLKDKDVQRKVKHDDILSAINAIDGALNDLKRLKQSLSADRETLGVKYGCK